MSDILMVRVKLNIRQLNNSSIILITKMKNNFTQKEVTFMKIKFNKKIVIPIISGMIAILAIVGIIIATNNVNNKEPNKKIVHDIDGTILYEFEDKKLIEMLRIAVKFQNDDIL